MARRDPVEYGTLLAKALGRKLDDASLEQLALIPPFHADLKDFITSLPLDDTPKKSEPKATSAPKPVATKKGAKSSGKKE